MHVVLLVGKVERWIHHDDGCSVPSHRIGPWRRLRVQVVAGSPRRHHGQDAEGWSLCRSAGRDRDGRRRGRLSPERPAGDRCDDGFLHADRRRPDGFREDRRHQCFVGRLRHGRIAHFRLGDRRHAGRQDPESRPFRRSSRAELRSAPRWASRSRAAIRSTAPNRSTASWHSASCGRIACCATPAPGPGTSSSSPKASGSGSMARRSSEASWRRRSTDAMIASTTQVNVLGGDLPDHCRCSRPHGCYRLRAAGSSSRNDTAGRSRLPHQLCGRPDPAGGRATLAAAGVKTGASGRNWAQFRRRGRRSAPSFRTGCATFSAIRRRAAACWLR